VWNRLPKSSLLSTIYEGLSEGLKQRLGEGLSKPEAEEETEIEEEVGTKEVKNIYGEFKNVKLTEDEYNKLSTKFNGSLNEKIDSLSYGIRNKGYKYDSHYLTILNWARKESKENPQPPEPKEL
jgi:hypothetical protein